MPIINLKELVWMAVKIIVWAFFKMSKSTEQDGVNTCLQFAEFQISFNDWGKFIKYDKGVGDEDVET